MKLIPIYYVNAFGQTLGTGNPAAVCLLSEGLTENQMQKMAAEIGFSETAFVSNPIEGQKEFSIRYFSPIQEIALCGHATLAATWCLAQSQSVFSPSFITQSGLILTTESNLSKASIFLPKYVALPVIPPTKLLAALGIEKTDDCLFNKEIGCYFIIISSAEALRSLHPTAETLLKSAKNINGVLVSAATPDFQDFDFSYRYFWPWSGSLEDPVTGSVHAFLSPYWSNKLQKEHLTAYQDSERGGKIDIHVTQDRIKISGKCHLYLKGHLTI